MFFLKKKTRYYLDPITLTIRKVEKKALQQLKHVFTQLSFALLLGLVWAFLFIKNFSSPAERKLERTLLAKQTEAITLQLSLEKLFTNYMELREKDQRIYRNIFSLPSMDKNKKIGIGGIDTGKLYALYDPTLKKLIQTVLHLSIQAGIQEESFKELSQLVRDKEKMLNSIPSIMPVDRKKIRISSGFGWRYMPGRGVHFHTGVDFAGAVGTPIFATGDGIIVNAHRIASFSGYGLIILIDHGYGFQTLYAHLSKVLVKPGQKVKRGQIIGLMGNSGNSTGPHLHYEIIHNGQKINPINHIYEGLTEEEYQQIIKEAKEGNNILS